MANLATQTITTDGLAPALAAAAGGGDEFTPDEDTYLEVVSAHNAPQTVTVVTPKQAAGGLDIEDPAVVVPGPGRRFLGPFPANRFANPADGKADITYSGVTALTIGVFKLQES